MEMYLIKNNVLHHNIYMSVFVFFSFISFINHLMEKNTNEPNCYVMSSVLCNIIMTFPCLRMK